MLSLIVNFAACAGQTPKQASPAKVAPDRTLPALRMASLVGGDPIDLGTRRGRVVLVDIWASWCAPCREELPLLDELAQRHRDKGIEVIAVSIDEEKQNALEFLKARPSWQLTLAHDAGGELAGQLEPEKMPSSYLFDDEGKLIFVNAGFARADLTELERRMLELAAAQPR